MNQIMNDELAYIDDEIYVRSDIHNAMKLAGELAELLYSVDRTELNIFHIKAMARYILDNVKLI